MWVDYISYTLLPMILPRDTVNITSLKNNRKIHYQQNRKNRIIVKLKKVGLQETANLRTRKLME